MPSLRELQLTMYDIFKEVVKVCEKHGFSYYLFQGTLLGAVRHGGFIPWDDDFDIAMPWKDFRKFIRYAEKELPDDLSVQTFSNQPGYPNCFIMVRKNGTSAMPSNAAELDIHWGIEIDIFPLIGVYKNKRLRDFQVRKMRHLSKILLIEYKKLAEPESLLTDPVYRKYSEHTLKQRIRYCRFWMFLMTRSANPSEIASLDYGLKNPMKKECYANCVKLKFEDGEYYAPCGYDDILRAYYGEYMTPPPEQERNGHELKMGEIIWDTQRDYSYYREQKRQK